jgi:hypothetical protein
VVADSAQLSNHLLFFVLHLLVTTPSCDNTFSPSAVGAISSVPFEAKMMTPSFSRTPNTVNQNLAMLR